MLLAIDRIFVFLVFVFFKNNCAGKVSNCLPCVHSFDMAALRYQPLDPEKDTIRLLTVFSDKADEQIRCEFSQVDLIDRPVYITLSYTWDQSGGLANVICCGVTIEISKNLRNFLHQFRLWNGNRNIRLWIDALCTD
jgi:hypothetical protein